MSAHPESTSPSQLTVEEELAALRREHKKATRELRSLQALLERSKAASASKASLDAAMHLTRTKQERYMNLLLENSRDIIILFDPEGRFAYCTAAFLRKVHIDGFYRINGRPYKEVFTDFTEKEQLERIDKAFVQAMRASSPVDIEETLDISRQGEPRDYVIHFTPMLDEKGVRMGAMALFHDVTKTLRAKEEAEKASAAKSNFLSNMSHEMRTPLNAVIGMTNIAKNSNKLEKKDYCLNRIEEASTHLLGVINDVLDMSKIEAGRFELSVTEFNFERLLTRVANVVNFRTEDKAFNFTLTVDDNLPPLIICDEQRLAQVITNLLSNAVKFTPENGTITLLARLVEIAGKQCTLEIEVSDTGIGISEEQQSRLFQSFSQADDSISRKYGGTGLGLAISKRIVEMMGGDIRLESTLGKGSRFIVTVRVQIGTPVEQPSPSGVALWHNLRVLAVDDTPDALEFFQSMAAKLGFCCDVALNGESALGMIADRKSVPYHVIFMNWKMPDLNGLELAEAINGLCGDSCIIIMAEARECALVEAQAKTAGVVKCISRPLLPSLIVDSVTQCLPSSRFNKAAASPAPEACFAGRKVLLAEDIEINREIAISLLENTGLKIDCAENGHAALEMLSQSIEDYDVVLMDIHMPEMDGYEATRNIRALNTAKARTIPIIAMTANVFREDRERCLQAGMNDHIGKPLDVDEMLATLKKYLKKH